jgi:hypothetical protein
MRPDWCSVVTGEWNRGCKSRHAQVRWARLERRASAEKRSAEHHRVRAARANGRQLERAGHERSFLRAVTHHRCRQAVRGEGLSRLSVPRLYGHPAGRAGSRRRVARFGLWRLGTKQRTGALCHGKGWCLSTRLFGERIDEAGETQGVDGHSRQDAAGGGHGSRLDTEGTIRIARTGGAHGEGGADPRGVRPSGRSTSIRR